jgi:hypothetical protein
LLDFTTIDDLRRWLENIGWFFTLW